MKAFCLAFSSFVVLVAPAAAAEATPPTANLLPEEAATASLETLLLKIVGEDDGSSLAAMNPADAEFITKLRAMLALAKDQVRSAAASAGPVSIDVRLRCVARRTVVAPQEQPSAFVPAVQSSVVDANGFAAEPAPAPAPATRLVRACAFKLLRRDAVAEQSPQMRPYTVELPVVVTEQAR